LIEGHKTEKYAKAHREEYEKYIEAVDLVELGGALPIENALELEKTLNHLLEDAAACREAGEASGKYVYGHTGATETIARFLQENRLLTS